MSITLVFPSDGCLCCFFHTICHCPPLVGSHPLFLSFLFFPFFLNGSRVAFWWTFASGGVRPLSLLVWGQLWLFIHLSICLTLVARCENGCYLSRVVHTTERSDGQGMKERTLQVQRSHAATVNLTSMLLGNCRQRHADKFECKPFNAFNAYWNLLNKFKRANMSRQSEPADVWKRTI